MNRTLVDRLTSALLYEGYMLYPYRPSMKNRQRWTYGGLYPRTSPQVRDSAEPWYAQTECLIEGGPQTKVSIQLRFLHLITRTFEELVRKEAPLPDDFEPQRGTGEPHHFGDQHTGSWQEAQECEVTVEELVLGALLEQPRRHSFVYPAWRERGPVRDESGEVSRIIIKQQQRVEGALGLKVTRLADELFKITARVFNVTLIADEFLDDRGEAQLGSFASTHTILSVSGGEFVSLMDPPERWRQSAASCRNVRTWPVLVGEEGQRGTMLSSPIILYDYPQVAPESPGDLFDCTEIDEILSLRILTLTDDEKRQAAAVDDRVRRLLERTEALGAEQFMGLHGTMRSLRPVSS